MVVIASKVPVFAALDLYDSSAKICQLARGKRARYGLFHGHNFEVFER